MQYVLLNVKPFKCITPLYYTSGTRILLGKAMLFQQMHYLISFNPLFPPYIPTVDDFLVLLLYLNLKMLLQIGN